MLLKNYFGMEFEEIYSMILMVLFYIKLKGTLTESGQEKWITPYYPHIINKDCYRESDATYNNAVICNNNV
jgi:hypothetical protein